MPCMITGASAGMAPAWLATSRAPPWRGDLFQSLPFGPEPVAVDGVVEPAQDGPGPLGAAPLVDVLQPRFGRRGSARAAEREQRAGRRGRRSPGPMACGMLADADPGPTAADPGPAGPASAGRSGTSPGPATVATGGRARTGGCRCWPPRCRPARRRDRPASTACTRLTSRRSGLPGVGDRDHLTGPDPQRRADQQAVTGPEGRAACCRRPPAPGGSGAQVTWVG